MTDLIGGDSAGGQTGRVILIAFKAVDTASAYITAGLSGIYLKPQRPNGLGGVGDINAQCSPARTHHQKE